jgi:hypothetical protein
MGALKATWHLFRARRQDSFRFPLSELGAFNGGDGRGAQGAASAFSTTVQPYSRSRASDRSSISLKDIVWADLTPVSRVRQRRRARRSTAGSRPRTAGTHAVSLYDSTFSRTVWRLSSHTARRFACHRRDHTDIQPLVELRGDGSTPRTADTHAAARAAQWPRTARRRACRASGLIGINTHTAARAAQWPQLNEFNTPLDEIDTIPFGHPLGSRKKEDPPPITILYSIILEAMPGWFRWDILSFYTHPCSPAHR